MAASLSPFEFGSLAQWVAAGATLLAVVVALFKEEIVRLWRRPELSPLIRLRPPDSHKTSATYPVLQQEGEQQVLIQRRADCYYFRIWIENVGRARAEQVQVFASSLSKQHADGVFQPVDDFLPMNLRWSHTREIFAEGIAPGMGKHCDVGHISSPASLRELREDHPEATPGQTVMALDLEVQPNTKTHLIPPGKYVLTLRIAGANCTPITQHLEITITGEWHNDQGRMFRDGVGILMV